MINAKIIAIIREIGSSNSFNISYIIIGKISSKHDIKLIISKLMGSKGGSQTRFENPFAGL
jgi:hypothetical protein